MLLIKKKVFVPPPVPLLSVVQPTSFVTTTWNNLEQPETQTVRRKRKGAGVTDKEKSFCTPTWSTTERRTTY